MEKIQNRKIITHYFNYEKRKSKIEKEKKPTDFAFFFKKRLLSIKVGNWICRDHKVFIFQLSKLMIIKVAPEKNINP